MEQIKSWQHIKTTNLQQLVIDSNYDLYLLNEFIDKISLRLMDYPPVLRQDEQFLTLYFSKVIAPKQEYAMLPAGLLANPLFIASCLQSNPDIYLLADKKCHSDFAFLKLCELHPQTCGKYANEKQMQSRDFCKSLLAISRHNYAWLPEEVRSDLEICRQVIKPRENTLQPDPPLELFMKYLPKPCKGNKVFIESLLKINEAIFPYLKKFHGDKELCNSAINKNTWCFQYASLELRNDEHWVKSIIEQHGGSSVWRTESEIEYRMKPILTHMPAKHFTTEFCTRFSGLIKKCFTSFPPELRAKKEIILSLYSSLEGNSEELYLATTTNKIADDRLRNALKDFIKSNLPSSHYMRHHHRHEVFNFLTAYFMKTQLEDTLEQKDVAVNRKVKL